MSETRAISTERATDWRDQADCRRLDPDWWFPRGATRRQDIEQADTAKAYCRRCPVAMQCATWALAQRPTDGIFGGLDVDQRRLINRRAVKHQFTAAQVTNEVRETWGKDERGPLVESYLTHTMQGDEGHVWWSSRRSAYTVAGRVLTPGQIAFEVGHGRPAEGHVKAGCGQPLCVAAEHLGDSLVRWQADHATAA